MYGEIIWKNSGLRSKEVILIGGAHEKHAVATFNFETISEFA
jgi:hypothetical protein